MKKLLAMILVLAMALSMTACGAKEEPAPEKEEPKTEATTGTEGEAKPTVTGTLDLSAFKKGSAGMWEEMVELFKEYYPDVEVVTDIADDNALRVRSRMLTDAPPDIVFISGTKDYNLFEAAADDMLYDLTDFYANGVDADGNPLSEILSPAVLHDGTLNGGVKVAPVCTSYYGWWYNETLFKNKGWTVPTTWDELYDVAEKANADGITPFMIQYPTYSLWGLSYELLASFGGYETFEDCLINLKDGAWTSEGALAAATAFDNLVKDGVLSEVSAGVDFTQVQIDFCNDRVSLIPAGGQLENEMKDHLPEGIDMTFLAIPSPDGADGRYLTANYYGVPAAIPAHCKNPEAAKAFLGVCYSKEGQKLFAKYSGRFPITNHVTEDDLADFASDSVLSVWKQANADDVKYVSGIPEYWYAPLTQKLEECNTNLILQEITPQQWCEIMEETADEIRADDSIYKFK